MSKKYDETNRISIWRSDRMREGENDASFTGSVNVEGVEYFVNLWPRKEGANPKSAALSGNIKRKDKQTAPNPQQSTSLPIADDDFEDSIPF